MRPRTATVYGRPPDARTDERVSVAFVQPAGTLQVLMHTLAVLLNVQLGNPPFHLARLVA